MQKDQYSLCVMILVKNREKLLKEGLAVTFGKKYFPSISIWSTLICNHALATACMRLHNVDPASH